MSSRIFQNVAEQLTQASQNIISVMDIEGNIIASGDTSRIGDRETEAIAAIAAAPEAPVTYAGKTFFALKGWNPSYGFAVLVDGDDAAADAVCRMSQVSLNFTKDYYEEKHDKGTFVKNIITDNILPGDIYIRAKELHFQTELPRAVLLIRQRGRADVAVVELLQSMFNDPGQDFVISVNETDIALVRQVPPETTGE